MRMVFAATLLMIPAVAAAQTSPPARSLILPPNPIDRATASSDRRDSDARQAAEADRRAAQDAGRNARSQAGPVVQSTYTDGVSGTGSRPGAPPLQPLTPQP